MKPRLPRLRLLPRVALALAAVGLLPLGLAWFGLVGVNREALFDQVLSTHALAARTGAARVGAFLEARLALARGLAGNPALDDPRSPAAQEMLVQSLQAWSTLGVEAVAVVNAAGEEVLRVQLKGERRKIQEALELLGDAAVTAVPRARPPVIRIAAPLPADRGRVLLVCDGSRLLEDVAHAEELGSEAEIAVAEADGRVVFGSVESLDAFPPAMTRQALDGRVAGAGRYRDRKGEEVLGAYAPAPAGGWMVLSRQPARVAEAVAVRLRWQSIRAIGAALALIAALLGLAWVGVVRPIRDLARQQRELAGARPAAKGGDEIQELRLSFEALRQGLATRKALDNVFLGRYQVLELLATGGMGSVFRGWDPRLQRPVALKTVRVGDDLPPDKRRAAIAQLVQEAVTAARFSHPNVVGIYDVAEAPEGAFIAMELVEGISLERLLLWKVRLDPDQVIPLAAAVSRGLAAAHAREVVHRDMKPANVLLGKDGSIKVADFGIADMVAAASQTRDRVFGTPGYLPPEALLGDGQGKAGDLFALGVILYECLCGSRPFGGLEVSDIMKTTLSGVIRPLSSRVPGGVPAELETLVLLLLERDPVRRPSNAAALAEDLERMAAARNARWRYPGEEPTVELAEPPELTIEAQWVPTARVELARR
ncbi:MAG TPA: serine/threonine protein kinase [Thermoanaerobaculia bacterium]